MKVLRFFPLACAAAVIAVTVSPAVAQNVDMGSTFDAIASTAVEVATTFRDAHAVTRKRDDGQLDTVLYDLKGQVLISLTRAPSRPLIEVSSPNAPWRHRIQLPRETSFAADWNNAQAWQLWRDAKASDTDFAAAVFPPVVLQGKLLRLRSVRDAETLSKKSLDVDDETVAVQTRFPRFVALSTKKEDRKIRPGGIYATFTARLQTLEGVTLGYIRFFKKERIVSWSFVNGERGVAREEQIPGGFKFTPNMAWANVQAVWFQDHPPKKPVPAFANQISSCAANISPQSAKSKTNTAVRPVELNGVASLKNRVLSWFGGFRFLPSRLTAGSFNPLTVSRAGFSLPFASRAGDAVSTTAAASMTTGAAAQTPCDGQSDGCTGLHWLDGSVFRQCCDRHDLCFEKDCSAGNPPCTAWSWLKVWDRWECTKCNIAAVFCFVTFGGGGGDGGGGGGGGGGADEWCWSDMDCPDGYICEWDGKCKSWF